jgi:predicted GNAT family N-acyltransferase
MPLKILDYGTKEYEEMLELRNTILRRPLGLSFDGEDLSGEKDNILLGCFEDDKLEACCMLVPVDKHTIQLRQMAVSHVLQGKGIGRALLEFSENIARDRGYSKIMMHARETAVGFYERSGYKIVGEKFIEVNIPHFEMEKMLQKAVIF